ncbi:MAG: hypothetical protein OXR62_12035 [Ahrensia sp.]|nr:hypothetical protein [Ahrensia sp.]
MQKLVTIAVASWAIFTLANVILALTRGHFLAEDLLETFRNVDYYDGHYFSEYCEFQFEYFLKIFGESGLGQSNLYLSGMFPALFGELFIQTASIFIFSFLIIKYKNVSEVLKIGEISILALVLTAIDQFRYAQESIYKINKNTFTYSSYCFQGDISSIIDIFSYFCIFFLTSIFILTFVDVISRLFHAELHSREMGFGYFDEFSFVEITFVWTRTVALAAPAVWIWANSSDGSVSIAVALEASAYLVILVAALASAQSLFVKVKVWHDRQDGFLTKRLDSLSIGGNSIAGVRFRQANLVENRYEVYVGTNYEKIPLNLISIAAPILAIVDTWFPDLKDILGGVSGL